MQSALLFAQPVMTTGGQQMPEVWIDQDTRHVVKRLTSGVGNATSFYFHNNPFLPAYNGKDFLMVYYGQDNSGGVPKGRQLFTVNLKTMVHEQLTFSPAPKGSEIVAVKHREVFYQVKDSVYATHVDTKKTRLVFVFPAEFKGTITTLNADETILAGAKSSDEEKEILRKNPDKGSYFNLIYEAKLERVLFSINIQTGELKEIYREHAWLNHVQFSPTDPDLLMYCHEGPWHKVDRIWTINIKTSDKKLMHKRTIDMEIAGHEWFSPDGKKIWYDLQQPRSTTFYVAAANVYNDEHEKYRLQRNEWSIHFTRAVSKNLFAGDGADPGQVARAKDAQWIYIFKQAGDSLQSSKLVNMKFHNYKSEPNVHFSPDEKWVIFRANFEGSDQVYAVKIKQRK
jgi:oligogalacturonide lyase